MPTRHVDDGLPFAGHGVPYLRVGAPAAGTRARRPHRPAGRGPARGRAAAWTVALARELDGARLPGPYAGYDSTSYEIDATTRALGPMLATLGGPPTGRADLDRLATRLYEA